MKNSSGAVAVDSKMNTQDYHPAGFSIGGEPDSPSPLERSNNSLALFNSRRTHSRSSSWSFNGSTRPGHSDLGSSIAAINPIRSVIREFVPTLGTTSEDRPHRQAPSPTRPDSSLSLRSINSIDTTTTNYNAQSRRDTPPITVNSSNSLSSDASTNRDQPYADHAPGDNEPTDETPLELTDGLRWIEQNTFFFALIFIRYSWINKSDLFVLIAMFATYFHCNDAIRRQVALKNRREKFILFLVILFLLGNISFVYFVFKDEELYNCLAFMPPVKFLDLWSLVWCIGVTDFIVRFVTMIIKSLVSLCFLRILPTRKKGKYYVLVEYLSQFYRTLLPTPLWFGYFSNYTDTGAVFAVLVTALYLMIKGAVIISRGKDLIRAIRTFINDKSYGILMRREDLVECGETQCSICQDDFSHPIKLKCHHVFCEDCVLQWFDRERTCPLCRASIGTDPKWRDGATSSWPQIF